MMIIHHRSEIPQRGKGEKIMKIKDLFKAMEKANQFAEMVGDDGRYELEVCISEERYFDWYFGKSFKDFKEFQKYCKEEYNEYYRDTFNNAEIEMKEEGDGEGHFTINHWWKDTEENHIIKVHIWRRK